jgi:hypothetical protein
MLFDYETLIKLIDQQLIGGAAERICNLNEVVHTQVLCASFNIANVRGAAVYPFREHLLGHPY